MNDHPDLVALLRGELSNVDVTEVGEHLDHCDECRHELADTAVGHALLTGTTRTLGRPERLALPEVPPLKPPTSHPRGRAWLRPLGLVAAAAALAVGTLWLSPWSDTPPAPPASGPTVASPGRTAELVPVQGTGSGRVVMAKDSREGVRMTIEVHGLPKIGEGQFYEVWLFNPKTQKMLALGVLGPGGKASFDVAESLVGRYQAVDISLERDDGDPGHSVTSVLRAQYT